MIKILLKSRILYFKNLKKDATSFVTPTKLLLIPRNLFLLAYTIKM